MEKAERVKYDEILLKWALEYTQDYLTIESGNDKSLKYDYLTNQLLFFKYYLNYLYIDGIRLKFVKDFFKKQTVVRDKSRYTVKLDGGGCLPVFVELDEIRELDLIDSKHITFYKRITIYNRHNRKWTKRTAEEMIKNVREDLEWQEGDKASIKHRIHDNLLILNVRVKEVNENRYLGEDQNQ